MYAAFANNETFHRTKAGYVIVKHMNAKDIQTITKSRMNWFIENQRDFDVRGT